MAQPSDDLASFPAGISIDRTSGVCQLSPPLTNLLVTERQLYDWPDGTGAAVSQQRIISLEAMVATNLAALTPVSAHQIVISVSEWAGNNDSSHAAIVAATSPEQLGMQNAIRLLASPVTAGRGIDQLSALTGISLVIASKIYRFCVPSIGAAVDRHSSYFCNSLPVVGRGFATNFQREWTTRRHTVSRLAIYHTAGLVFNSGVYFSTYIPLLRCIADCLNHGGSRFVCAATGAPMAWTPADVEMAMYYWWAHHGSR